MNFIQDLKLFLASLTQFLRSVFNIQKGSDSIQTITEIKKGLDLSGANVWILVASAIIASVGLDLNSHAVIIGAMLISPLMAPILGLGLSFGINDKQMLFKSISSLCIAVGVSLLASYLYFVITPLGDLTEAMAARTKPNSLDTIIAFAGGIAGIVAGTRKEKTNAIPGVAIATALMPPICTAGFGLASGRLEVFGGAFYLFLLNAIFIALSTYMIVRLLKFPYVEQVDELAQRKVKRYFLFFLLLIMVPSVYTLVNLVQQERVKATVDEFVQEEIKQRLPMVQFEAYKIEHKDDSVLIRMALLGNGKMPEDKIELLNLLLDKKYKLKNARLWVIQNDQSKLKEELLAEIKQTNDYVSVENYKRSQQELAFYKAKKNDLEQKLKKIENNQFPYQAIESELRVNYEMIEKVQFASVLTLNDSLIDTIPTVFINLKEGGLLSDEVLDRMQRWLRIRLKKEKVVVKEW